MSLGVAHLADGFCGGTAGAIDKAVLRVEELHTLGATVWGCDAGFDELAIDDAEIAAGVFAGINRVAAALDRDGSLAKAGCPVGNRCCGRGADDLISLFAGRVSEGDEQTTASIA